MSLGEIAIKGIREGLLVRLPDGNWEQQLRRLEGHLQENRAFFSGGRVALDIGDRELTRSEIARAQSLLARHQVELWALLSSHSSTREAARGLGLVVRLGSVQPPREPEAGSAAKKQGLPVEGLVLQRTIRSGQSIRHLGHVVVLGDVNPGGEVVASGHVIVWGRVRGIVHAGALGNEEAVICGLDLAPTQLRIADHISRPPEEGQRDVFPEMAVVRDGRIEVIPWPGTV